MKKLLFLSGLILLTTSCSTSFYVQKVGGLSSVSTRNIDDSKDYELLRTYAGLSSSDIDAAISHSKNGIIKEKNPIIDRAQEFSAKNIQEAVNKVVRTVPGGEFLRNVKIYTIIRLDKKIDYYTITGSYIVTGDVWGINSDNIGIKGFHKGDSVAFVYTRDLKKELKTRFDGKKGEQYSGTITQLKGATAIVQLSNGTLTEIPYSYLMKME